MIKRVKNWWLKVRVLYLVFKQYWNADDSVEYRNGTLYASVEKRMANYLSELIVRGCPTVLQNFKETFEELEKDDIVVSEFGLHEKPKSKVGEIGILGSCIEELYFRLYGGGDYKNTPMYMAGYHQGLADGAKYLDKVIPFADADDKTVKPIYSETYSDTDTPLPRDVDENNPFEKNEDLLNIIN